MKKSKIKKLLAKEMAQYDNRLNNVEWRVGIRNFQNRYASAAIQPHFDEVTEGLPEKWCVYRDADNYKIINLWANTWAGADFFGLPSNAWFSKSEFHGFSFPSGYTEITFETFKKYVLKEEVKEAVELEVGKWYTLREDSNVIACYLGEHRAYGLNGNGIWSTNIRMSQIDYWEPATESEVFEALKAEAEKRGFKEWAKVDLFGSRETSLFGELHYNRNWLKGCGALIFGNDVIFREDKGWATIIPQPEAIDFSKAGQLVEVIATGQKWITSGTHTDDVFDGTLIVGSAEYVGKMRTGVLKKYITLCTEPVTLQNQ